MLRKPLTISLVIPVYNEESHLADCLRAALAQRQAFDEIIVVDNNSTDATVNMATQFHGVQVIHEKQQGVVHARNSGFASAQSDIIARIDADTLLPTTWSQQLTTIFSDPAIDAVTGAITYHDVGGSSLVNKIDLQLRRWLAAKLKQRMFLLGANMAIRRTVWQDIQGSLCGSGVHEDLDLASHLATAKAQVTFVPELLAGVSGRRVDTDLTDFVRYVRSLPRSYAVHGGHEHRYMYPVITIVLLGYLPLKILYRGYDSRQQLFRLTQLLTLREPHRVNPVSFTE